MNSFTPNELPDMTDALKKVYEGKKKEDKKDEKSDRWQDDDGDGKWYEKSDVDGKISKREKEEAKKNAKKEEVELDGEQLDEISADLALKASKKADIARGKAAHAGDKETAVKKNQQAQRLYAKQAAKRKNESVIKSKKQLVQEDIIRRVYENMKGNTPALNQFREDNSLGKLEEGEKVARGALKRAQELGAKRRRREGVNRGVDKNERAGYKLSQAARSRDASLETQATKKKKPAGHDTSQIGHAKKRDEKTSVGKKGGKLKTPKYKLTFKQRMAHHSNTAYNRRDPKQNPKHTANTKKD